MNSRKTQGVIPEIFSQKQIDSAIERGREEITNNFEHNVMLVFRANGLDYNDDKVKAGIIKRKNSEGVVTMFYNKTPMCSYDDGTTVEVIGTTLHVKIRFTSLIHTKIETIVKTE